MLTNTANFYPGNISQPDSNFVRQKTYSKYLTAMNTWHTANATKQMPPETTIQEPMDLGNKNIQQIVNAAYEML